MTVNAKSLPKKFVVRHEDLKYSLMRRECDTFHAVKMRFCKAFADNTYPGWLMWYTRWPGHGGGSFQPRVSRARGRPGVRRTPGITGPATSRGAAITPGVCKVSCDGHWKFCNGGVHPYGTFAQHAPRGRRHAGSHSKREINLSADHPHL